MLLGASTAWIDVIILVSIVVPYFRLERLVEETLRSALAQTYPAIEVVLVIDEGRAGALPLMRGGADPSPHESG